MIINPKRRLENELDFDFRADMKRVETIDDFENLLLKPFQEKKQIFYRGERKSSITRPLLPTLYRNKNLIFNDDKKVSLVNSETLYSTYSKTTEYFKLYEKIIGKVDVNEMYSFLAFSQHYFGSSPLIDFTKSLYVALSFALKDRDYYNDDILLYTLELNSKNDYTNSVDIANQWIKDYSVLLFRDIDKTVLNNPLENPLDIISDYNTIAERFKGHSLLELNAPSAKLIDAPSNDLMKFQQGVFLLLDDFSLLGRNYLTKKIRDEFSLKKWIINKSICPQLLDMIVSSEPYYQYKYITNLSSVAQVIKNKASF